MGRPFDFNLIIESRREEQKDSMEYTHFGGLNSGSNHTTILVRLRIWVRRDVNTEGPVHGTHSRNCRDTDSKEWTFYPTTSTDGGLIVPFGTVCQP